MKQDKGCSNCDCHGQDEYRETVLNSFFPVIVGLIICGGIALGFFVYDLIK